VARQAAADQAARTAKDAVVNAAQATAEDDEPAPRKWTAFFRRRPKAPVDAKVSAPHDDVPVPRWVNGRWESN